MYQNDENNRCFKIRACRVCLDMETENNVLLNGEDGWFDLLEYCVGINTTKTQDEPHTFCTKCTDKIWDYVEFKKKCLASNLLWKSLTTDNMTYQIENYTKEIENSMKKQLLNNFNTISIPKVTHDEKEAEDVKNNNEDNVFYFNETEDLLNSDYVNEADESLDNINNSVKVPKESNLVTKDLNTETNAVPDNGSLKCQKCNKTYGRKGWLKMHMKLCGKTRDERKNIRRINKELFLSQEYICGICKFSSCSEESVSIHFEEHSLRNDLACRLCDYVGNDFADMVAHRFSHSSKTRKVKKSCPTCKKTFISRLSMEFHYRSAHLNKKGGYCSKCDLEFSVYKTFESHIRSHGGRKYVCDICGLKFFVRSNIIEHIKNHKAVDRYICHECGKGFKRHNNLSYHIRTVHVKEGPLKCNHCNKMFKNYYTLKTHRKRQLGTKNSLKCEFCGKCFASPHLLRSHRFWHTEERPHCCEVCGSRYKAKGQLKVHMQNHTGSKPFECSVCNKCFPTARQLRRHNSVHTGIRAHKCPHCERTFHSKKLMSNHCALRHRISEIKADEIATN